MSEEQQNKTGEWMVSQESSAKQEVGASRYSGLWDASQGSLLKSPNPSEQFRLTL